MQWNWGAATPDQASELVNDEKSDVVRQQLMKDLQFPSNGRQDSPLRKCPLTNSALSDPLIHGM